MLGALKRRMLHRGQRQLQWGPFAPCGNVDLRREDRVNATGGARINYAVVVIVVIVSLSTFASIDDCCAGGGSTSREL